MIRKRIILLLKKIEGKDFFVIVLFGCIILLSWHPFLSNDFINDDFQILGWLKPYSLSDIFKPLFEKEPILFYWRPLVNFLNSLTLFIFGFNPFPFILQNFIIYSLICYLIYKILKIFGIKNSLSVLCASIFAILPSHDLPIAWIACRYDLFMTLFILFAVYFYLKITFTIKKSKSINFILLGLFSFLAVFSKEHSFFLLGFGGLMYFIDRKKIRIHIKFTTLMLCFIASYFLLRFFLIGGSPFSSSNFSNIKLPVIATNFLIYIITSLIHAELFLRLYQNNELSLILLSQALIILFAISLVIYYFIRFKLIHSQYYSAISNRNLIIKMIPFGFSLYLLSIIPVLPVFMRWYSFLPFIGLIILIAGLIFQVKEKIDEHSQANEDNSTKSKRIGIYKLSIFLILVYISLTAYFNYVNAKNWNHASKEMTLILNSLGKMDINETDSLTLWGIPDKIEGVNAMRLGVEQAVHHALRKEKINVKAPLRAESDRDYFLNIIFINDSTCKINLTGGILRHQFTDRLNIDSIYVENEEYYLTIQNSTNYQNKSGSATLIFKKHISKNINLLWTGKEFIRF